MVKMRAYSITWKDCYCERHCDLVLLPDELPKETLTKIARHVVEEAAGNIGLAFQIQDDILDVTSTVEELGKPVHSDEKNNKVTYVTLFGTEKASVQVEELSKKAIDLLKSLNKNNEFLYLLIEKLINRRK